MTNDVGRVGDVAERAMEWPLADPAIARAMLAELASTNLADAWAVHVPSFRRADPPEVWLPEVGAWVRADGSLMMLDQARGYFRLSEDDALAVRDHITKDSTHG